MVCNDIIDTKIRFKLRSFQDFVEKPVENPILIIKSVDNPVEIVENYGFLWACLYVEKHSSLKKTYKSASVFTLNGIKYSYKYEFSVKRISTKFFAFRIL